MCVRVRELYVTAGCTSGCKASPQVPHELESGILIVDTLRNESDADETDADGPHLETFRGRKVDFLAGDL
jgi:hypothetical protein